MVYDVTWNIGKLATFKSLSAAMTMARGLILAGEGVTVKPRDASKKPVK